MPQIDEAGWTRDLAQELQALRTVLSEHAQSHGSGDSDAAVLRKMIASRERLLRTSRL
jgi:hypothetical protein